MTVEEMPRGSIHPEAEGVADAKPAFPRDRLVVWVLALLLVGSALAALALALRKPFSIDEFDYAHAAWLVSVGQVPYRDFFDHHFPLLYQLLALLAPWAGDRSATIIRAFRLAMLLPLALSAAASWWLVAKRVGRRAAMVVPLLLLTTAPWLVFAVEVRPDNLAMALFLTAVAALDLPLTPRRRGAVVGAILALAVWASQKVLVYGAGFAVAFVLDLLPQRRRRQAHLGNPWAFLASFVAVGACLLLPFIVRHCLTAFAFWCFRWPALFQAGPRSFPWTTNLVPALLHHPWLPLLAAIGLWVTVTEFRRGGMRGQDLVLLLALPLSWASYAVQNAPFPYSELPLWTLLALFSALGLPSVIAGSGRLLPGREGVVLAALLLVIGTVGVHNSWPWLLRDNSGQLAFLETLDRVVGPGEPVYANSGSAVARPHVDFFFFTNAWLRRVDASRLAERIPREIEQLGAVAWIRDVRSGTLPSALRHFLHTHFVPYLPDLWLWGRGFRSAPGEQNDRFVAIRDGEYLVWPSAAAPQDLAVDGRKITLPRFRLRRGAHHVTFTGKNEESGFFILLVPHDGRSWRPHPGPSTFSRLFG